MHVILGGFLGNVWDLCWIISFGKKKKENKRLLRMYLFFFLFDGLIITCPHNLQALIHCKILG